MLDALVLGTILLAQRPTDYEYPDKGGHETIDAYSRDRLYRLEEQVRRIENEQSKRAGTVYSVNREFREQTESRQALEDKLSGKIAALSDKIELQDDQQKAAVDVPTRAFIELKAETTYNSRELDSLRQRFWALVAALIALALPQSLRRGKKIVSKYTSNKEDDE